MLICIICQKLKQTAVLRKDFESLATKKFFTSRQEKDIILIKKVKAELESFVNLFLYQKVIQPVFSSSKCQIAINAKFISANIK